MKKRAKSRSYVENSGINPEHFSVGQLKFYAYLIPLAVVMVLPIIFIFANAFKPLDELFAYPPRFYVKNPTFQNFIELFNLSSTTDVPASRYLANSIISTALVVICTVVISVITGYTLSKKQFKSRNLIFKLNTLGLMFVPISVQIPRYFVLVGLGLRNNFLANVIPLLATPVCVFLVKQFIDQIPNALIEAAYVDGANDFTILRKVIFPLSKPVISTVVITTFQSAWNSMEASQLFIDNEASKTFAFYMSNLSSAGTVSGVGVSAAATLIMFLPNIILFIILQSGVVDTMAHSGIK